MAYGKKYYLNFNDYSGNTYIVNLNKKDYAGSASEIKRYPIAPVTHTYRGGRDNINDAINGSEVNLSFYVTPDQNNRYDEIFESDYKDWQLEILKTGLISDGYGYDSTVQSINLNEDDSNGGKVWSQTNTPDDNIITGLNLTNTGNSYSLHWTNPTYNFTPASFKILVKTDSPFNPYEPDIAVNGSSVNKYTWTNIGEYPGPYSFAVAACSNTGGVNPREFSSTLFADLVNANVPYNVSATTSGNNIVVTWLNPAYSVTVQSFAINRLRLVGGLWTEGTLFTFNNNGSAVTYTDTNIGAAHTNATYKYQVAIATGLAGVGRSSFSDFSNSSYIYNTNVKPNLTTSSLTSDLYFGGNKIYTPITISGGSGTFTLNYRWDNGGSNHSESISATANGTVYNFNLPNNAIWRGATYSTGLRTNSGSYNLYGTTGRTLSSPALTNTGRVENVALSGGGAGSTVTITWDTYNDSAVSSGNKFGYAVSRYLLSDVIGSMIVFEVAGIGSTSYIDNISALAAGEYYYNVSAISKSLSDINAEDPALRYVYYTPTYGYQMPINIT